VRKCILILGAFVLLIAAVGGCKSDPKYETLLVAGSTEMLPYTKALVKGLSKKRKNLLISYDGGGSTPGIIALRRKAIDVAAVSRLLTDDEDDAYTESFLIAKGCIAIIVHPDNPVQNMTKEQVYEIFDGHFRNWEAVGGNNAPIRLLTRKYGSYTRKAFQKIAMSGGVVHDSALRVESGKEMADAVAEDPDAIGYLSLYDVAKAEDRVSLLSINWVRMDKYSILSGRYPFTRSFYYVLYHKPPDAAKAFLRFALSGEGQKAIEEMDAVRVR